MLSWKCQLTCASKPRTPLFRSVQWYLWLIGTSPLACHHAQLECVTLQITFWWQIMHIFGRKPIAFIIKSSRWIMLRRLTHAVWFCLWLLLSCSSWVAVAREERKQPRPNIRTETQNEKLLHDFEIQLQAISSSLSCFEWIGLVALPDFRRAYQHVCGFHGAVLFFPSQKAQKCRLAEKICARARTDSRHWDQVGMMGRKWGKTRPLLSFLRTGVSTRVQELEVAFSHDSSQFLLHGIPRSISTQSDDEAASFALAGRKVLQNEVASASCVAGIRLSEECTVRLSHEQQEQQSPSAV